MTLLPDRFRLLDAAGSASVASAGGVAAIRAALQPDDLPLVPPVGPGGRRRRRRVPGSALGGDAAPAASFAAIDRTTVSAAGWPRSRGTRSATTTVAGTARPRPAAAARRSAKWPKSRSRRSRRRRPSGRTPSRTAWLSRRRAGDDPGGVRAAHVGRILADHGRWPIAGRRRRRPANERAGGLHGQVAGPPPAAASDGRAAAVRSPRRTPLSLWERALKTPLSLWERGRG